jgi:hypothetical protein
VGGKPLFIMLININGKLLKKLSKLVEKIEGTTLPMGVTVTIVDGEAVAYSVIGPCFFVHAYKSGYKGKEGRDLFFSVNAIKMNIRSAIVEYDLTDDNRLIKKHTTYLIQNPSQDFRVLLDQLKTQYLTVAQNVTFAKSRALYDAFRIFGWGRVCVKTGLDRNKFVYNILVHREGDLLSRVTVDLAKVSHYGSLSTTIGADHIVAYDAYTFMKVLGVGSCKRVDFMNTVDEVPKRQVINWETNVKADEEDFTVFCCVYSI